MLAHGTTTAVMTLPEPTAGEEVGDEVLRHFREHGPALYRFSRALLRQHHDAEDVVQEAFLKLLKHLQSGGDASNLRGWLFTVAAHACRDRQRFRIRWRPWAPVHEAAVPPVDEAAAAEEQQILEAALRRLPPRDRLLLALRLEGVSYRDIASAAGLRAASVGTLLARALRRWERECSGGTGRV